MVVVKLPELEKTAIEPFFSASAGASPPSAPPMRTLLHASANPRLLPPNMSMPFCCPIARVVHRKLFGDDKNLLQLRIDTYQLGNALACGRRRQIDHSAIEAMAIEE